MNFVSQLPNHVYRFSPKRGDIRVVANDARQPNGICFSVDGKTAYVTDTSVVEIKRPFDGTKGALM